MLTSHRGSVVSTLGDAEDEEAEGDGVVGTYSATVSCALPKVRLPASKRVQLPTPPAGVVSAYLNLALHATRGGVLSSAAPSDFSGVLSVAAESPPGSSSVLTNSVQVSVAAALAAAAPHSAAIDSALGSSDAAALTGSTASFSGEALSPLIGVANHIAAVERTAVARCANRLLSVVSDGAAAPSSTTATGAASSVSPDSISTSPRLSRVSPREGAASRVPHDTSAVAIPVPSGALTTSSLAYDHEAAFAAAAARAMAAAAQAGAPEGSTSSMTLVPELSPNGGADYVCGGPKAIISAIHPKVSHVWPVAGGQGGGTAVLKIRGVGLVETGRVIVRFSRLGDSVVQAASPPPTTSVPLAAVAPAATAVPAGSTSPRSPRAAAAAAQAAAAAAAAEAAAVAAADAAAYAKALADAMADASTHAVVEVPGRVTNSTTVEVTLPALRIPAVEAWIAANRQKLRPTLSAASGAPAAVPVAAAALLKPALSVASPAGPQATAPASSSSPIPTGTSSGRAPSPGRTPSSTGGGASRGAQASRPTSANKSAAAAAAPSPLEPPANEGPPLAPLATPAPYAGPSGFATFGISVSFDGGVSFDSGPGLFYFACVGGTAVAPGPQLLPLSGGCTVMQVRSSLKIYMD
jgi:hypothetical protein